MSEFSGITDYRARYYDRRIGAWLSLDPLETANRYGYVDGNVVNAVDMSGFSPACEEEPVCTCPNGSTPINGNCNFTYNRERAANWAIHQARSGNTSSQNTVSFSGFRYDPSSLTGVVGTSTGSATFISEAMYVGGIPMTVSEDEDTNSTECIQRNSASATGWRVCPKADTRFVDATSNWSGHKQLIGYMFESNIIGGSKIGDVTFSLETSERYSEIAATALSSVQKGDYMFSDHTRNEHGFLIIGWGPAKRCSVIAQDEEDGNYFTEFTSSGGTDSNGLAYVPYVVDYNDSLQGNVQAEHPRPYYCPALAPTAFLGSSGDPQGPWTYDFYAMPDNGSIPCNRIYQYEEPDLLPYILGN